ncbi:hypothetical protein BO71DRAFT_486736 [Aspergillus ellipticus CBS 707.79]|uniref:Tat pathway signal sequence n=1 Tax=Aspergillus ellipticus CBS 707.79 TaxID=1448320 RepID=A0A319D8M6_9EURO|nr:hypothetical protein BO71DRAFT_486736 [Aspergillus ellipticus CBS 707.79]
MGLISQSTEGEDDSWESKETLLGEFTPSEPCRHCESRRKYRYLRWLVYSITPMVLILFGIFANHKTYSSKAYWTSTEFVAVKKELPQTTKQVRFTATLQYNASHQLYRPIDPSRPQYVGKPSPELDAAWKNFLGSSNIFVTAEEEPTLGGGLYLEPDSNLYMAEIGVMHDLHCLNVIRQSVHYYWDYYKAKHPADDIWEPHLEHCIDSLRESLSCAGDMTAMPLIWDDNGNRFTPGFAVEHTCRDYEALRVWANRRDSSTESRWPENAARIHSQGH